MAEGQDGEGGPLECQHRYPLWGAVAGWPPSVVLVRRRGVAATMAPTIWTPPSKPPHVTQNGSIGLVAVLRGATVEEASERQGHPVVLVTKLVGLGQVSPRNASIWLRAAGMAPAPLAKKDLAAQWNLTVRHVHNAHRTVTPQFRAPGTPVVHAPVPSGAELEAALAAVHARLDIGDHGLRRDAARALDTLTAQPRGAPVPRGRARPQDSPTRGRGYRLRAHLKKHIERLPSAGRSGVVGRDRRGTKIDGAGRRRRGR